MSYSKLHPSGMAALPHGQAVERFRKARDRHACGNGLPDNGGRSRRHELVDEPPGHLPYDHDGNGHGLLLYLAPPAVRPRTRAGADGRAEDQDNDVADPAALPLQHALDDPGALPDRSRAGIRHDGEVRKISAAEHRLSQQDGHDPLR